MEAGLAIAQSAANQTADPGVLSLGPKSPNVSYSRMYARLVQTNAYDV